MYLHTTYNIFYKFPLSLSNNLLLCNFSITHVYTLFIRMPKVFSIFVQLASIQVHSKVKFPTSNPAHTGTKLVASG